MQAPHLLFFLPFTLIHFHSALVWGLNAGGSFVDFPSGTLAFLIQFSSQFISLHINSHLGSSSPLQMLYGVLHLALLDCHTPKFVSDLFFFFFFGAEGH